MKVFLHIGMPKTGSTTIQRTLLLNQAKLLKARIYFPYRTDCLYGLVTKTDPGPKLEVPKGCNKVIISDERLFNKVRSSKDAQIIADALREIAPKIRLVCYVRREDEVFTSAYFTRLLMGRSDKFAELPLNPVQTYKRLSSWQSAFGRKNMILRRFGRPYLENGLIADFAKAVEIERVQLTEAPAANQSPRCDVLEVIRLLNERNHGPHIDRHVLKAIARAEGFDQKIGLAKAKRQILIDKSAEANRKLSALHFSDEPIFTHALADDEPDWPAITPVEIGKIGQKMARMQQLPVAPVPDSLDAALDWIAALARTCAATPRVSPAREPELQAVNE